MFNHFWIEKTKEDGTKLEIRVLYMDKKFRIDDVGVKPKGKRKFTYVGGSRMTDLLPLNARCGNCHWLQYSHCAEPRNHRLALTVDLGGNNVFRIDVPRVEETAFCDFWAATMRNNYRAAEVAK